jgi:hypothetical protein
MSLSVTDLLALVFCGFLVFVVVMRRLRRRAAARASSEPVGSDFSLETLQELHRSGQLTADEFERAKAAVQARQVGGASPLPAPGAATEAVRRP